ncbi:enterobactin non-ribosomal peptide synthetase EntF [Sesbania bispinosa]|nr:enterobactin non-ribosomal peptide synthetase EntF [Sesbania bispinosa]
MNPPLEPQAFSDIVNVVSLTQSLLTPSSLALTSASVLPQSAARHCRGLAEGPSKSFR